MIKTNLVRNFIPAIMGILGITKFREIDGKKVLSDQERESLHGHGFSDQFVKDFEAALNEPVEKTSDPDKRTAAIAAVLGQTTSSLEKARLEIEQLKAEKATDAEAHQKAIEEAESRITELESRVQVLSDLPDVASGTPVTGQTEAPVFNLADEKQLGGIAGVAFGLDRAYNRRARLELMAARGMYVPAAASTASADPIDYKLLQDDLGAFYRQSWQQRLQDFLVKLPSIFTLFPTESGHQDLDTLVNIWLGEFSQAENSQGSQFAKVAKGSFEFGTETLRMYGVMFVHIFQNMKWLEKSWIGYLNREGSNPVKLSFIEYLLTKVVEKLHNEQQQRMINGVRKNPKIDEPGRAVFAADGLYEYLRKRVDGHIDFTPDGGTTGKVVYQIKPFDLPLISEANIGEVFYQGTSMIPAEIRDSGQLALYIPSYMLPWYDKYNETKYGQNTDYKGAIRCVKEFPAVQLIAVPNADNHRRIFWTLKGNIQTFDHVPGEMLRFFLEQQDWSLKVWSHWKESIQAIAVGYKYTDKTKMDGSRQLIWCNDEDYPSTYYVEQEADVNPSALIHSSMKTAKNKEIFTITDIEDARVGQLLTLKCGADGENGVQIKKEGNFSTISEAWEPKVGDEILLMKREDGKFIEISRVAGQVTAYVFPADATAPSVKGATVFATNANTKTTAIADIEDALIGVVYTIHGAGETNASTIASGDKFDLTKAMTLKAGTFIQLVLASDGKFHEVGRG